MIIAENCDRIIKTITKNDKGALSYTLGSYYNEFQIINNLGEDIFALDHQNKVAKITPQPITSVSRVDDRHIRINYRFVHGTRDIGSLGIETTPSTQCTMKIPFSVLLESPVFVEEINALIFHPRWHVGEKFHPHSAEYITAQHDALRADIGRAAVYNPITIMANDPTGKIKALHVVLNGQIFSVKVTACNTDENESDVVAVCVRGVINGDPVNDCKIFRTTFAELHRIDPLCWEICGFTISKDRVWLENKLEVEKSEPIVDTVPVKEVKSLIEKSRSADALNIEHLTTVVSQKDRDLTELKKRYAQLTDSYNDLVKGGYLDRSSDIAFKKIDLEETSLHTKVKEAQINQTTERLKLTKEQISVIVTIAKTIAVLSPLILVWIKHRQKGA